MTDIDFLVMNRAPDADSCSIRVLAGNESVEITVWRDKDQVVHINIEENRQSKRNIILGKEGQARL